jgi:hypothetical protein
LSGIFDVIQGLIRLDGVGIRGRILCDVCPNALWILSVPSRLYRSIAGFAICAQAIWAILVFGEFTKFVRVAALLADFHFPTLMRG